MSRESHLQVTIQLPLHYNITNDYQLGKEVEKRKFLQTYYELYDLAGGVHTSNVPVMGAWKDPESEEQINDECLVFNVVIPLNNAKINELKDYKKKLLARFKQKEIFMIAMPCYWL